MEVLFYLSPPFCGSLFIIVTLVSHIIITTLIFEHFTHSMDSSKKRSPSFKISVPGDDVHKDVIFSLRHKTRDILVRQLNRPINKAEIIETVFKTFLDKYSKKKKQRKYGYIGLEYFSASGGRGLQSEIFHD